MSTLRLFVCSVLVLLLYTQCHVASSTTTGILQGENLIVPETATIDQFGHLYYATSQRRIIKFNEHGDSIGYYANNSFGDISLIDVTNPLKVLVYFRDFYTGIVLDRLLNETQTFNMLDLGHGEIRVIASSIDGAMWIFNDHEQRLIKATQQGQVLQRGEDLRLRFNERLTPDKIAQSGESLYLKITGRGLLIFDLFGQFKTQLLEPEIEDFQLYGKNLLIRTGKRLQLFDPSMMTYLRSTEIENAGRTKILCYGDQLIKIDPWDVVRTRFALR